MSRSIVRVVESTRWIKDSVMNIKGTPFKLRPRSESESDAHIEEHMDPHVNADQHPVGDEVKPSFDNAEVKRLDRQLRIAQIDIDQFGNSENCPKCRDLKAGKITTTKLHNDECRLRFYLCFKESNHAKWQAVKHILEDQDSDPKFRLQHVDKEGAPVMPPALFETEPLSEDIGFRQDAEMDEADFAPQVNLETEPME